jgi:RNA polymerase sigma-70 factor (ECF subfamily)
LTPEPPLSIASQRFRRHLEESRERLFRVAFSWCHDAMLADDLVHECMAKALQNRDQLKDPERMDSWLFRILSNCWKDQFRRRRDEVEVDELTMVQETTPEDQHNAHQLIARVREAMAALAMPHRQVVTLVDLEGFSYAEVAEVLGIPVGTVMSRLSRARHALRRRLLHLYPDAGEPPSRIRRVK